MNSDNDTSRDDNTSIFLPVTVEQIHHDTALIGQDSGNPSVFEPSVIDFLYENARQLVELVLKGGHKARERKHLEELLDKMSC